MFTVVDRRLKTIEQAIFIYKQIIYTYIYMWIFSHINMNCIYISLQGTDT